jgi:hypothetical protein
MRRELVFVTFVSAALRRKIGRNTRFAQRRALLKEPVEADSRHPNEISEEDMVFLGKPDRLLAVLQNRLCHRVIADKHAPPWKRPQQLGIL